MTIFKKIINQEIPCYKIAESKDFLAFLDISPIQKGHTLVIPKLEIDHVFDLPPSLLNTILSFAQPIAKAIQKAFNAKKCGISVIGLEVPHAHLHLIPINEISDMNFEQPKLNLSSYEFLSIQKSIISHL